jgi:hypothetical protein
MVEGKGKKKGEMAKWSKTVKNSPVNRNFRVECYIIFMFARVQQVVLNPGVVRISGKLSY